MDRTTSLLSLPIDGPNAKIHDKIRNWNGHFNIITKRISEIQGLNVQTAVKINTVVMKPNIEYINEIAGLLYQKNIIYGVFINLLIWSEVRYIKIATLLRIKNFKD